MNRILITLMTFTLIWSCSNNSKTSITSSIDTSKFEGMNPDSVFNNVTGQTTIDSTELKKFWIECINPIIDNDKDKLEKIIQFPLEGDWGFMMELNKVDSLWTKQDFFDSYNKLFSNDLIEKLKVQSFKNIEVFNHNDGTVELLVHVGWETMIDRFKDEYGIIFRFKKIENDWKLYVIQGVG